MFKQTYEECVAVVSIYMCDLLVQLDMKHQSLPHLPRGVTGLSFCCFFGRSSVTNLCSLNKTTELLVQLAKYRSALNLLTSAISSSFAQ